MFLAEHVIDAINGHQHISHNFLLYFIHNSSLDRMNRPTFLFFFALLVWRMLLRMLRLMIMLLMMTVLLHIVLGLHIVM